MLLEKEKAPDFNLLNEKGENVTLADFRNKRVILYFYPKDDTPGCTTQACSYRDHFDEFVKRGYQIVGISKDDLKSHQKFLEKYELNFTLLSDPDTTVIQQYGCWKEKSLYGKKYMGTARTTFILDEEGTIVKIFENVDPKGDVQQVLSFIDSQ
ncbi:MAG: thioredoxin-dependent thiol peroxidase [Erysipelothrix sp.]|nr:thioredoxin-dependent thiol peroxidase [Erysipelothrix sp.]